MFVIIGTTTVDLFVSGLERMPVGEGDEFTTESLVFCKDPLRLSPGGNGCNCAYVLARLGASVTLCSAVGRDVLGDLVEGWLTRAGVDTAGLVRSAAHATSSTIILEEAGNRKSFHHPGVSTFFAPDDLPHGILDRSRVLLVSAYPLLASWRPDGVARALSSARRVGAVTALDIGPAVGRPAVFAELAPLLPDTDYLFCNEHELAVCTGTGAVERGVEQLLATGAAAVVVKRGRQGVLFQARDAAVLAVPGFAVEARSTVGAGDAFNAGFLYGLQQGWDSARAIRFANAVAAGVVSSTQGVLGCPDLDAVERFLGAEGAQDGGSHHAGRDSRLRQ